jgi:hypothetical protein
MLVEALNMLDVKTWREKWEAMNRADIQSLREMTIEESVKIYLSLCQSIEPLIEEARDVFFEDRKAYLIELQGRLRRFGEWKRKQNGNCAEPA